MLLILTAVGSLDVKFRVFNQRGLLCMTMEEQWNLRSVYVCMYVCIIFPHSAQKQQNYSKVPMAAILLFLMVENYKL
jgi:hypothetical protein